jgi:catechol 2,3-dioxygenase-like lactoylglutathione lyase family enzyme
MAHATLEDIHPVLPSKDVTASIEFYVDRLGFTLLGQDSPSSPRYAVLRRDRATLHIQWHDPAEWEAAADRPMLRFVVPAVEDLFDEYKAKGVFHDRTALRDTPWGTREFAFYDLYQNGLTFFRNVEET